MKRGHTESNHYSSNGTKPVLPTGSNGMPEHIGHSALCDIPDVNLERLSIICFILICLHVFGMYFLGLLNSDLNGDVVRPGVQLCLGCYFNNIR